MNNLFETSCIAIREQDPLKQGLKLTGFLYSKGIKIIREQDPLKQGLKLVPEYNPFSNCADS